MSRAVLVVLDSVGIGGAADAAEFGDEGANTLGHIVEAAARGYADRDGLRAGNLLLPNMNRLGLAHILKQSSGVVLAGGPPPETGACAIAREVSPGKDTPSGHWELAGVPVPFDWGYFPHEIPSFPADLTDEIIKQADLPGILANRHGSGTDIIAEFGEEHIRTGKPICYTSADSVFQIAAHEEHFGLQRLYDLCEMVHKLVAPMMIGRVIARPFVGNSPADFKRTNNRRDIAIPPPADTILDRVTAAGHQTLTVGKIADIFAHSGISKIFKAAGNAALFEATLDALDEAGDGDLVFANLIDFDQLFGHRRDVPGYAAALEAFDQMLPRLTDRLAPDDLLIITADHGCDPTWKGTDHTRENVPVLMAGPGVRGGYHEFCDSFADVGETIAAHLGLAPGLHGQSIFASAVG
jgi:phosphopentomutase